MKTRSHANPSGAGTSLVSSRRHSTWAVLPPALVVLAAVLAPLSMPSNALAATPGCKVDNADHCYSILEGSGSYHGIYGTWNRAKMGADNSAGGYRFVDSEMWAAHDNDDWVETGDCAGYVENFGGASTATGYHAFWAVSFNSGATYREHTITALTANDSVTDEWQISNDATSGKWDLYFDGTKNVTTNVGWSTTPTVEAGAEVATSQGTADPFHMVLKAFNASGTKVAWGNQTHHVDAPLKGNSPASSQWNWSIS